MDEIHSILYAGKVVGTVRMTRHGLYTLLRARCTLPDNRIYKLLAAAENGSLSLGTLCPVDSCFGLESKIPSSRLGQGSIMFTLACKDVPQKKVCIEPDVPFPYLSQLEHCRLLPEGGKLYALLPVEKNG